MAKARYKTKLIMRTAIIASVKNVENGFIFNVMRLNA